MKQPKILVVAGKGECQCLVRNLQELGSVVVAEDLQAAVNRLQHDEIDVVFSAWDLAGGRWTDLLATMRVQGVDVPTIVYYHCAGEAEWARSLKEGAFDLLAPPFDPYKLSITLEHALASRVRLPSVA